jgi:transcriptional regulator
VIYTPKYFAEPTDSASVLELVKTYNFATLLVTLNSKPLISHLPFHYMPDEGTHGTLYAHMAIANRQARCLKDDADVTVIFQGPHSFISPTWYTPAADNVPTWNYSVVHMHGKAQVINDDVDAYAQMKALVELHDSEFELNLSDKDRVGMLREICVFKIGVEAIDAKFKLSQNRSQADQDSVIKHLKMGSVLDQETAKFMARMKKSDSV